MKIAAIMLWLLNLLDTLSTYIGLHFGIMREMNPVMAWLWNIHPLVFLSIKVVLGTVVAITFLYANSKLTKPIAIGCVIAYAVIAIMHVTQWMLYLNSVRS